jgi:hypothetical protein
MYTYVSKDENIVKIMHMHAHEHNLTSPVKFEEFPKWTCTVYIVYKQC